MTNHKDTIDDKVHQFRTDIIDLVNGSELPITVLTLLVRELANELSNLENQSLHSDSNNGTE